jgi:uncharacterized membrane protein YphA (DoxX/SURF4 family)
MKWITRDSTMTALRIVLGLVVLERSCSFVFATRAAEEFARTGWPNALRLALGWCEIAAAVLFLVPWTVVAGAWSLVAVFVFAVGLHVLHGEYNVGPLLVWTVAVLAVLAHRRTNAIETAVR